MPTKSEKIIDGVLHYRWNYGEMVWHPYSINELSVRVLHQEKIIDNFRPLKIFFNKLFYRKKWGKLI